MIQPKQQVKREGLRPLSALAGCVMMIGMSGCGVTVEPLAQPNLLIAPDELPPRADVITNRPSLNLIPRRTQTRQASAAVNDALTDYQAMGYQVIEAGADPRFLRLQDIFASVHAVSHMADEDLRPILITRPVFQAYTKGGLEVIFYTGLTERLNDDELAIVVGHEIAHISAGHVAEQGSRDIVNVANHGHSPALAEFYSVEAEVEADRVGLVYAALAGFDISAAGNLWAKLSAQSRSSNFNLFSDTHPSHDARADMLDSYSQQLLPVLDTASPEAILQCNPLYCAAE